MKQINIGSDELLFLSMYTYSEPVWNPLDSLNDDEWVQDPFCPTFKCGFMDHPNGNPDKATIRGMEVGDDRVDLSNSKERLELEIKIQSEVLMMKTSIEDTSITKNIWNFTEVTGTLPCAKEESFDYVRKTRDTRNLGYLDCPRLRIILDTHKGNFTHSNSSVGKAGMLARDTNLSRAEFRENIQLSSFLQDAFLQTVQMADPKYLPRLMGGCGASAPFGVPSNTYSYVKCFKHGTYERVYGTGTNELAFVIRELEAQRAAEPIFCKRLRDKQEYLHGTYAEKVFVPNEREITSPFWSVPRPIYRQAGTSIGISSVENRLIRAKKLIGAKAARVLVDQRDRIVQAVEGLKTVNELEFSRKVNSSRARTKFEGALQANSAFQRLLCRCANDTDVNALLRSLDFRNVGCGARFFELKHAEWLHRGGKGKYLNLQDIRESEDMYVYSEISLENSLRVSGIPLKVIMNGKNIPTVMTVKRIGLYEISSSQEQWADKICSELLSYDQGLRPLSRTTILDTYLKDPEWVNDDSLIISRVIRDNIERPNTVLVVMVSADKKLAKQLARTCNVQVALYSPHSVVRALRRETWNSQSTIELEELVDITPSLGAMRISGELPKVYIDTGSLMAAAVLYRQLPSSSSTKVLVMRDLVGVERVPHRSATYIDQVIPGDVRTTLTFDLIHPGTGKPRHTSYRDARALSDLVSESSASTDRLTINSRARTWATYNTNA